MEQLRQLAKKALDEARAKSVEIESLSSALEIVPIPMWIKSMEGEGDDAVFRMVRINRAYESMWGIKRSDYEGHYDWDVWGDEVGQQFRRNDMRAIELSPKPLFTTEIVTDSPHTGISGIARTWRIAKVAPKLGPNTFVYGVAYNPDGVSRFFDEI